MRPISRSISGSFRLPDERASLHTLANVRWGLLVAAVLLAGIGLVVVASASATMHVNYLPRQALAVALGLMAMMLIFSVDYQVLLSLSLPIYAAAIALLALVLLVGHRAGGAQSWLSLGPLHFQPSEIAKLMTAILLARVLADADQRYVGARRLALVLAVVAVPMFLVVMERDLGGAVMYLPMVAGMLLVAGV
ncbi:MAG TPA: FtsW/RodA/SpoVE family cell cycle protein, partial [Thermoanaerobaculia bacterium]|nr:FtsW/RodA/SpoVE family cell cycle protein [Thermoanaerobaculia bacterium]